MSTEAEIIGEIEELGRLTEEQEDILYNIALRQEELGRQPTIMQMCIRDRATRPWSGALPPT